MKTKLEINKNPYYSPESSGLEIFDSYDRAESCRFDTFVIWKKTDDGTLYYGRDSGCSCPIPFDDFTNDDLTKINKSTFYNFDDALKNHYNMVDEDYRKIKRKVKEYLNKK